METRRLDQIREEVSGEESPPHIGAEAEFIMTNDRTHGVIHSIEGSQPTAAFQQWLEKNLNPQEARLILPYTVPDVPESTIEANPLPLHSPRATAAATRLMAIILEHTAKSLSIADQGIYLLPGAAWRPSHTTPADVSQNVALEKQIYYKYQIATHGNKVAEAAGEHLNLSLPRFRNMDHGLETREMVRLTGLIRLIGVGPAIALCASSPLYHGGNGGHHKAVYGTAISKYGSARLGEVWPGRTIMDTSSMWKDHESFIETMERFAQNGVLLFGRDIWLLARAQAGEVKGGKSFQEACQELSIDLSTDEGKAKAATLLTASFEHGPNGQNNPHRNNTDWQAIETWRQDLLHRIIHAPRNRVELRMLETPPFFEEYSPYAFKKSMDTFLELLFIQLAENPDFLNNVRYGEMELQAAKHNEERALVDGLEAEMFWIPTMGRTNAREILKMLLKKVAPLAEALDRKEDLSLITSMVEGDLLTPALQIRKEAEKWYNIHLDRGNKRTLPDDSYPQELIRRSRAGMGDELKEIEKDLGSLHAQDRPYIQGLLDLAKRLRQN